MLSFSFKEVSFIYKLIEASDQFFFAEDEKEQNWT